MLALSITQQYKKSYLETESVPEAGSSQLRQIALGQCLMKAMRSNNHSTTSFWT